VGVVWITWCILEFYTPLKSLERLKLETSKFVRKLARWSISLVMTEYPTAGRGQGHVIHFYILGPSHIFGADEATLFEFGLQIERTQYYHYTY